jgi:hypothetical protein
MDRKFDFFLSPWLVIAAEIGMISAENIFGRIDSENVSRATLVRIMQLRDFRQLPPETVERITERAEKEFGRHGIQKPTFSFSNTEKKVYAYFQTHRSANLSFFETNLNLMSKLRYIRLMNDYEQGTKEQRNVQMQNLVEEMRYWQTIYIDFLRAADLPIPTLAELIQEFQTMIQKFKEGEPPEMAARIDDFTRHLTRTLVAKEIQGTLQKFLPRKNEKKQEDEQ